MMLRQGLQFAVSVALARLLSPEEFGTIALLALFAGIASAFVDSGFSAALIREQNATHIDESTVFWFNLAIGCAASGVLLVAAPAIASFYGIPILVPLTWVMALNVLMSAVGAIHGTLLTKALDFRSQMNVGIVASVLSGTVAIWMAWRGFGIWALAAQTIVATTCTTVMLWMVNPWRPAWVFSPESAGRLFGFGSYLLAANLLDISYNRLYTILIGKFFGVRELGFYSRADGTKQLPVGVLTGILSRVAFPVFSAAANDPDRLRRGVQMSVRGMMLINFPMMLGLAALAEVVVVTLLGEKWLPAARILQVLCLAGVFWPLHVINLNVLMAQGHSNLFFRLEVVKKVLGIALLAIGTLFGVMGIAWSTVLFGGLAFLINAHYTKRFLDYGAVRQIVDFAPIAVLSFCMYGLIRWVSILWSPSPFIELSTLVVVGVLTFVGLAVVFRIKAFRDAIGLFRQATTDAAMG